MAEYRSAHVASTGDERRLIVIGASAGGVEALSRVVAALPEDLGAAVAVVLHISTSGTSVLPQILDRAGSLKAVRATDGDPVRHGCIHVAPPNHHLVVRDGVFGIDSGPRENGHRPAVDPLFFTAAREYGPAAIGVILTGTLDDGAAGLAAIKLAGGVAVVQDPDDALYAGMPASALERTAADHVVPLAEIGELLVSLVGGDPPEQPVTEIPREPADPGGELDAGRAMAGGEASGLSCPECGGSLWFVSEGGADRFRCRVGHAYSEQSLAEEQGRALEMAMWAALRALEERAALMRRMARRAVESGHERTAVRFTEQATDLDDRAATIRRSVIPSRVESDPEVATGS